MEGIQEEDEEDQVLRQGEILRLGLSDEFEERFNTCNKKAAAEREDWQSDIKRMNEALERERERERDKSSLLIVNKRV